jgi:tRNA nucleotidyltransferase (CCA-adding enzyme)
MQIYSVGGAVRDELLGLTVQDRDFVVVGATPQQMAALGYRPVGKDFPVFLHPETHEEYALARTERKTAKGYKGFQVQASPEVTLEQDLARRDLTINAIARDVQGALIDPYGGISDLRNGILRHVSPAFVEDPVRILRVARFAARFPDFVIADETLALMGEMVESGEVDALVAERGWQELAKGLMEARPSRMFGVLRDCGALHKILPELDRLWGVPQPPQHHPEIDTGIHTLQALDVACELSNETTVRFAALVHDIGKGVTPPDQWPSHIRHEQLGVGTIGRMCERLKVPTEFRELGQLVSLEHQRIHRATEMGDSTVLNVLEAADAFRRPERFDKALLACEADARGRGPELRARPYPQAQFFRDCLRAAAAVRLDAEVMKQLAGPAIAQAVRAARVEAIRAVRVRASGAGPA